MSQQLTQIPISTTDNHKPPSLCPCVSPPPTHTHSLTYHTLVVDKALLQSIVRDRLAQMAAAAAAASRQPSADASGRSSGGGGMVHRATSALRRSLSNKWSLSSRGSGGGSRRWEGRAQGPAMPQSDNPRWNEIQATTSV
jgi:hypothetical protein